MDLKYNLATLLVITLSWSIISTDGFFFFPNQLLAWGSSSAGLTNNKNVDQAENEVNNNNFQLKSILPHRIQATLLRKGEELPQGNEENGGIGSFGRNILKGVQTSVTQIMSPLTSFLNREQSERALDMEEEFYKQTDANQSFRVRVQTIFPGTLWCGGGNKARSDDELGTFRDTDNCCRDHDMCFDNIPAGEEKHGLKNSGLFTRSHCNCDRAFYNCLKEANSVISNKIGFTYFTILGPQCFSEEYPIMGCDKRNIKKCIRYKLDQNSQKKYQWIDNDLFLI